MTGINNLKIHNKSKTGGIEYSNKESHTLKYNLEYSNFNDQVNEAYYFSTGQEPASNLPLTLGELKSNLCPNSNTLIHIKNSALNLGEINAWSRISEHATTTIYDSSSSPVLTEKDANKIDTETLGDLNGY
jgi:hypothetical protein